MSATASGSSGSGQTPATNSPQQALAAAFSLPRAIVVAALQSRTAVVEAVFFATGQTGAGMMGGITKSGTVSQTVAGWQYSPTPADRLVVRIGNEVHEFSSIEAAGGAGASTASAWLEAPHRLSYRHRAGDLSEGAIDETIQGGRFETHMTGWTTVQGQRYDVDLWSRGQSGGNILSDSRDTTTEYALTGSIRGGAAEIEVKEQNSSHYVSTYSVQFLPSQRGYANDLQSAIATTVKIGSDTYSFSNVRGQAIDKEKGGQRTSGVVSVSGQILRNGTPFATCTLQGDRAVAIAGQTAFSLDWR